jgi:hypothetical protein
VEFGRLFGRIAALPLRKGFPMTARIENDVRELRSAARPRDHSSKLKLPHRNPEFHGDELDRLDEEIIAAHEKRCVSLQCTNDVNALNYQEQAKCHLKRAKEINAHLSRCGVHGASQAELAALERFVRG